MDKYSLISADIYIFMLDLKIDFFLFLLKIINKNKYLLNIF